MTPLSQTRRCLSLPAPRKPREGPVKTQGTSLQDGRCRSTRQSALQGTLRARAHAERHRGDGRPQVGVALAHRRRAHCQWDGEPRTRASELDVSRSFKNVHGGTTVGPHTSSHVRTYSDRGLCRGLAPQARLSSKTSPGAGATGDGPTVRWPMRLRKGGSLSGDLLTRRRGPPWAWRPRPWGPPWGPPWGRRR